MVMNKMKAFRVSILTIGNEVLSGIVLDTNTHWLTNQIVALGGIVSERMTIRDETNAIVSAVNRLLEDKLDLVITSGGLGPTYDDITVKSIAQALDLPLVLNSQALDIVRSRYLYLFEQGRVPTSEVTPAREKMAWVPEGALILDNKVGSAPGVDIKVQGTPTHFICLPGVPSELKNMFEESVLPLIKPRLPEDLAGYYQKIVAIKIRDESLFSPIIDAVASEYPSTYIKSLARAYGGGGVLRLWVSCRKPTQEEAARIVEKVIQRFEQLLGVKAEVDDHPIVQK